MDVLDHATVADDSFIYLPTAELGSYHQDKWSHTLATVFQEIVSYTRYQRNI
jgi:hypothetical protein